MTSRVHSKFLLAATFAGAIAFGALSYGSQPAHAQGCGALPDVEWWSKTHQEVEEIVQKNYKGQWQNYIARWQKYRDSMEKIYKNKGVATVKSRGIELRDDLLEQHIADIDTRLEVLACLKAENEGSDLTKFETAGGGGTALGGNDQVAKAIISGDDMNVQILASCDADTVVFKITNQGARWPKLASIQLIRTDNRKVLSKRSMRLAQTQQVTFRIGGRRLEDASEVGLYIEPTWFERPFKFDSVQNCS